MYQGSGLWTFLLCVCLPPGISSIYVYDSKFSSPACTSTPNPRFVYADIVVCLIGNTTLSTNFWEKQDREILKEPTRYSQQNADCVYKTHDQISQKKILKEKK